MTEDSEVEHKKRSDTLIELIDFLGASWKALVLLENQRLEYDQKISWFFPRFLFGRHLKNSLPEKTKDLGIEVQSLQKILATFLIFKI